VVVPSPIATANYWHRSLNPKKLIDVGFSTLPYKTPMARYLKMNKLPKLSEIDVIGNIREM
jgi:glycylpeptide N-tetradecanoyltransferase